MLRVCAAEKISVDASRMSDAQIAAGIHRLIWELVILRGARQARVVEESLSPRRYRSASRRHDRVRLNHEHHRPLRSPRTMHHALWDHHALSRRKLDGAALDVDEELA